MASDGDYWSEDAGTWTSHRDRSWRTYSDTINSRLCRRWLPSTGTRRLLKTDLFDEAAAEGLWPALAELSGMVVGVDVSKAIACRARARHADLLAAVGDVRSLSYRDGSFDAIVSNSTLDHFERREGIARALRELYRVLAAGGHLVLTLDNPANPIVALRNALSSSWLMRLRLIPYRMGRTMGVRATRELLAEIGFRVTEETAIIHCPRLPAIELLRLVDSVGMMRNRRQAVLRALERSEVAEGWPTRYWTGHFVALLAQKPAAG